MTTPDWEPLMKQASLIITRKGEDIACDHHREEFGIPAIVGCSDALEIPNLSTVTGSCAEGDIGYVYTGEVPFEVEEVSFDEDLDLKTKISSMWASPPSHSQTPDSPLMASAWPGSSSYSRPGWDTSPCFCTSRRDEGVPEKRYPRGWDTKIPGGVQRADEADIKSLVEAVERRHGLRRQAASSSTSSGRE